MGSIPLYEIAQKKVTKVMPTFSFAIPKINFYVNTPSVSVTSNNDKFQTEEKEGKFNILNPNTKPVYFNDIIFKNARVRDMDTRSVRLNTTLSLTDSYDLNDKFYQEYTVRINGFTTGLLTIVSESGLIGSNKIIPPLNKLEFYAFYEVKNLGVLNKHYYGKSSITPNKRVGIIDFNFNIKAYSKPVNGTEINEEIVISTILVNT